MSKKRYNVCLTDTTDIQLKKMIGIVPFLTSRSQAIAYAVQQFIVEWAIDNNISLDELEANGEYEDLDRRFSNRDIPTMEETKRMLEERREKRAKMKEEIEKAKEKAREVKIENERYDLSELDE